MSYCVNCGVKLDPSCKRCPLCNTPVINPNEITPVQTAPPFPKENGQVETVKKRDLSILLSVTLIAACAVCILLNLLVFPGSLWCLYVIGACFVIWVLAIPLVVYARMPIYISLLCDGLAIALYQYLIGYNTPNRGWFWDLGLPITALLTVLAIVFAFLYRKVASSYLATGLYFFAEAALLCIGIELLLEQHLGLPLHLTWSAVVLSICAVIVIVLVTILSRERLRTAVRRRLHF